MGKRRVTFEVDTNQLFDMLSKMKGETADLGHRVVGSLLQSSDFFTAVGMAAYGVVVVADEVMPEEESPSTQKDVDEDKQ